MTLNTLAQRFLPKQGTSEQEGAAVIEDLLNQWRTALLKFVMRACVVVGFIAIGVSTVINVLKGNFGPLVYLPVLGYILIVVLAFAPLSFRVRSLSLLAILYLLGLQSLLSSGTISQTGYVFQIFTVFGLMLISERFGWAALGFSAVTMLVVHLFKSVTGSGSPVEGSAGDPTWFIDIVSSSAITGLILFGIVRLQKQFLSLQKNYISAQQREQMASQNAALLQKTEQALKEAGEKVSWLDALPTFVAVVDLAGKVKFVNAAPLSVLNDTRTNLTGKLFWEASWWPQGSREPVRQAILDAARGSRSDQELDLPTRNGSLAVKFTAEPMRNDQGNIDTVLACGTPIVEQRQTVNRLKEVLDKVREAASELSSASAEILAATTQQASGASEQSAAISQTTTTVEEVRAISEQASQRALEVSNSSQRTAEVARSGQKSVQDTIDSMAMIKERVEGISENILALSDKTQQIGDIISTVNEIASQSNMLALNASVEVARAGEHGKGFAVVAMEVRSLAEQSREATAQVKTILSEIQKATNTTVMATEEGTKDVEKGVNLAAQAGKAIQQLASVLNESSQAAAQMVAGGQQQLSGIEQIAMAMQNINQATVQGLTSTRQAEKSAQALNYLATELSKLVTG